MHSLRTRRLVETALMIALGMILSMIVIFRLPFGGSITLCSMLPLILIACRYGTKWGLFAGFVTGLLQTIQAVSYTHLDVYKRQKNYRSWVKTTDWKRSLRP